MKYFVYIHTCPNQKRYIGITTKTPNGRWDNGKGYRTNEYFYHTIQKYGWDNIQHEVFETKSVELMSYWERILIYHYNTMNSEYGFNRTSGGEGFIGVKHSDATKKKISESLKGYKPSDKTRIKLSESHKGKHRKPHSNETKQKMSKSHKGRKLSEETKRKISETLKRKRTA